MTNSSRLRLILSVVSAALLLAGVVAVVADGDDDADTLRTGSRGTSTTATDGAAGDEGAALAATDDAGSAGEQGHASAASTAPAAPKADGKGAAGGPPTAGSGQAPAPSPASGDPGQAQPTKVGTYTYDVTVDGEQSESTHLVEAGDPAGGGETRQVHTRKGKDGELKNQVLWKADGLYLEKTSGSGGQGVSGDCDWNPDILVVKIPLAKDTRWVSESGCSGTSPYGPYTLKARFESVVSGTARITVGGQGVDVWVIDTTQRIDITAQYQGQQFTATQEGTSKNFYAPKHGLSVREESQSTASSPAGQRKTSSTRVLKSLSPR